MIDRLWTQLRAAVRFLRRLERRELRRVGRFERRELKRFLAWIENTRNLIHVSILLFVPLLIAGVTALSNTVSQLSFLLFPPLAAGTYTLFANPTGKYASPKRFVVGLTIGALCGWIALEIGTLLYGVPAQRLQIDAAGAGLSVFLTGAVTWLLDIEEPAAFSTALLILVTKTSQVAYVLSIAVGSALVAGAFTVWKRRFYHQRSRYLYRTTSERWRVLVPVREGHERPTSLLAGRLAGPESAGEVVLLDIVDSAAIAEHERDLLEEDRGEPALDPAVAPSGDTAEATAVERAEQRACEESVARLREEAERIRTTLDVPCEIVVAVGSDPAVTTLATARNTDCDLIVTTYEETEEALSPFIEDLFGGDVDVVVHRAVERASQWDDILVPVRRGGDVANRMIEFATRIAGSSGRVSVCHCIGTEDERIRAEQMLSYLVAPFSGNIETRVSRTPIQEFLATTAPRADLIVLGASTDRNVASRFIVPPTFERIDDVACDMAIVHSG